MKNMRFDEVLESSRVFAEEPTLYSSTLKAVRRGYELLGDPECGHCAALHGPEAAPDLYYLV